MTTGGAGHRRDGEATLGPGSPAEVRFALMEAENLGLRARVEAAERVMDSATGYAIVTLDVEGVITGWNSGAKAILGHAEREAVGLSGEMMFVPEDRADGAFRRELGTATRLGQAVNERWHLRRDGTRFWASGLMMPLVDGEGVSRGFLNIMRDGSAAQAATERRAMLLAEMGHRLKNTLAVVQSVAAQTARHADGLGEFRASFEARLAALGRSHDALIQDGGRARTCAR